MTDSLITADMVAQTRAARAARSPHFVGDDDTRNDPFLKRSPDLMAMAEYWFKADSVLDGIEAMRAGGELFLPKFQGESASDYLARLNLIKMTNIYSDVIESLAAKPFEESTVLEKDGDTMPSADLVAYCDDIDGQGNSLTSFAMDTFLNGINCALDVIFVDHPVIDRTMSRAEARAQNIRPYWLHIRAANLIGLKTIRVGADDQVSYLKYFQGGAKPCVREYERVVDKDGKVSIVWRVYERRDEINSKTNSRYALSDEGILTIGVIPAVVFITGRRINSNTFQIKPPMRAAIELQIEMYQAESGLKYAKTLTAYPMLVGKGVAPEKNSDGSIKPIQGGPGRVLYAAPSVNGGPPGDWGYIEPSAESLKFLAADITEMARELRELGRQPLTVASSNLTTVTTSVAAGKAKSAVKQWAHLLRVALENAFVYTQMWIDDTDGYRPRANVFVEFDEFLDGKDLDTLTTARQNGDISRQTYLEELKRRAVLGRNHTIEIENKRLLDELPGDGNPTPDMRV